VRDAGGQLEWRKHAQDASQLKWNRNRALKDDNHT
jgi:hypothetical protein